MLARERSLIKCMKLVDSAGLVAKTRTFLSSLLLSSPASSRGDRASAAAGGKPEKASSSAATTTTTGGNQKKSAGGKRDRAAAGMKRSKTEEGLKNVTNLLMSLVGKVGRGRGVGAPKSIPEGQRVKNDFM